MKLQSNVLGMKLIVITIANIDWAHICQEICMCYVYYMHLQVQVTLMETYKKVLFLSLFYE